MSFHEEKYIKYFDSEFNDEDKSGPGWYHLGLEGVWLGPYPSKKECIEAYEIYLEENR